VGLRREELRAKSGRRVRQEVFRAALQQWRVAKASSAATCSAARLAKSLPRGALDRFAAEQLLLLSPLLAVPRGKPPALRAARTLRATLRAQSHRSRICFVKRLQRHRDFVLKLSERFLLNDKQLWLAHDL